MQRIDRGSQGALFGVDEQAEEGDNERMRMAAGRGRRREEKSQGKRNEKIGRIVPKTVGFCASFYFLLSLLRGRTMVAIGISFPALDPA